MKDYIYRMMDERKDLATIKIGCLFYWKEANT